MCTDWNQKSNQKPPLHRMRSIYAWLSCWCGADGYERDPYNRTICTCRFVVTVVITTISLLGLHARKLAYVHNCPYWGVLHVMNLEEGKAAQLSTKILGDMLLELCGLKMMSSKRREFRSREDLEGVGNSMDFRDELLCFSESWMGRGMCLHLGVVGFWPLQIPPIFHLSEFADRKSKEYSW